MEMGADAADIGGTIHPHPTLSETFALAAEMFEGTITDLMPRQSARGDEKTAKSPPAERVWSAQPATPVVDGSGCEHDIDVRVGNAEVSYRVWG
jgi:hypothetical protein